jgi:hypothetical protein
VNGSTTRVGKQHRIKYLRTYMGHGDNSEKKQIHQPIHRSSLCSGLCSVLLFVSCALCAHCVLCLLCTCPYPARLQLALPADRPAPAPPQADQPGGAGERESSNLFVYLSICLLARSCLGAARPRCIVAPGVPLERTPPASPPGGVLASRGVTAPAPGRLAPVPSPLTQTPLTQP